MVVVVVGEGLSKLQVTEGVASSVGAMELCCCSCADNEGSKGEQPNNLAGRAEEDATETAWMCWEQDG